MSREQLLADLDALDALFASEANWTQGQLGFGIRAGEPKHCGCISGGALATTGSTGSRWKELIDALSISASLGRYASIVSWNDAPNRTFADIKFLIARTKERVQQELQS